GGARGARGADRALPGGRAWNRAAESGRGLQVLYQGAASRGGEEIHQRAEAAGTADDAGARDAVGDCVQAASDAAGDPGDPGRELFGRNQDAAGEAAGDDRGAKAGDRAADSVPHVEGVSD